VTYLLGVDGTGHGAVGALLQLPHELGFGADFTYQDSVGTADLARGVGV
jgi:hypothetical protein